MEVLKRWTLHRGVRLVWQLSVLAESGSGPDRSGGMHVIQDETRVMMRYILIAGANARAPKAQDIRDDAQYIQQSAKDGGEKFIWRWL